LIQGFAEDLAYFQADQIHPNAQAQPIMLDNVWKVLSPLLPGRS
jgi:acyl-CoA thioesterase-1